MIVELLVVVLTLSSTTNGNEIFKNLHIGVFLEECEIYKNESAKVKELVSEVNQIIKVTTFSLPCGQLNTVKDQVCAALKAGAVYLMAWAKLPFRVFFRSIFNTLAPIDTNDDEYMNATHPLDFIRQVIYDVVVTWNWHYVYIYADRIYRAVIPRCVTVEAGNNRCHLVLLFTPQRTNVSEFLSLTLSHVTPIHDKHFFIICNEDTLVELLETAKDHQMFNSSFNWFLFNLGSSKIIEILRDLRYDSNVFLIRFHSKHDPLNKLLRLFTLQSKHMISTLKTIDPERKQLLCEDILEEQEVKQNVSRRLNKKQDLSLDLFEVIAIQKGVRPELVKYAVWDQTTRTVRSFPRKINFQGSRLKIATLHSPPYVFVDNETTGNFSGYLIELLKITAEKLNFSYEIYVVPDKTYGNSKDNKNWTGVIGAVHREEADLGVANLTPTEERSQVVQFLEVFVAIGGFQMLYKNPQLFDNDNYLATFSKPFSRLTWISTTITLMIMSFALCAMNEILVVVRTKRDTGSQLIKRAEVMPSFFTQEFRIRNWVFIAIQVAAQQGFSECPSDIPTRIPFISLWIFSLLLYSSYSATLTSYFTFANNKLPFDTLPEVLKQKEYKFGLIKGTAYFPLLNSSSKEEYKLMLKMILDDPSQMVSSIDEGYERVKNEKYVFFHDQQTMRWLAGQTCGILNVGPAYMKAGVTFAVPYGSQFAQGLNWQLGTLAENGLMKRLQKHWWPRPRQCTDVNQAFKALTVMNVMAPFLTLTGGLLGAAVVLFIERVLKVFNSCCRKHFRRQPRYLPTVYIPSSAFAVRHYNSPTNSLSFSFTRNSARTINAFRQDDIVTQSFNPYSNRIYRYSADKQPHVVRLQDRFSVRFPNYSQNK